MEKSTGNNRKDEQKKKKKMTIYTVNKIQEPKKPEEEPPKESKVPEVTPEQVGAFIGELILTPLVLMFAWNFTIPALFGLTTISFLQAFGLLIIARCFRQ